MTEHDKLIATLGLFNVSGPDDDGLVWMHLRASDTKAQGMVNLGKVDGIVAQVALLLEEDRAKAITALSALERPTLPESSADYQQRRGVAWDIIDQAINTYDGWMLDDDYRATEVLREIIDKMRSRRDAFLPKEAPAEPVHAAGDGVGEPTKGQLAAAFSAGAAEMKRAIRQAEPEFHGSGKLDDYNAGWDGGVVAYRYAIAAINPSDLSPAVSPDQGQDQSAPMKHRR